MLNLEEKLDFKEKIKFSKENKISSRNFYKDLLKIITHIKESQQPQILLIFYCLFFLGLNYSLVARITLKNFKHGFKVLTIKKRKLRKFLILDIIRNMFYELFATKNNKSCFFL